MDWLKELNKRKNMFDLTKNNNNKYVIIYYINLISFTFNLIILLIKKY